MFLTILQNLQQIFNNYTFKTKTIRTQQFFNTNYKKIYPININLNTQFLQPTKTRLLTTNLETPPDTSNNQHVEYSTQR